MNSKHVKVQAVVMFQRGFDGYELYMCLNLNHKRGHKSCLDGMLSVTTPWLHRPELP